jgi:hypothetical protein
MTATTQEKLKKFEEYTFPDHAAATLLLSSRFLPEKYSLFREDDYKKLNVMKNRKLKKMII